ncbi:MAG: outer membrane protein assembly factor BamB family protein [Pirellulaceae bacterium]
MVRARFASCIWLTLSVLITAGCGQVEYQDAPWLLSASDALDQPRPGQWQGHRGGMLQGVASERGLPVQFGPDANKRWELELPGPGNSSPTVVGDRIFLTTELSGEPPQLGLLCIDRVQGRLVWQRNLGHAVGRAHHKNGFASATVASDGQCVFATFGPRGIFCFTLDGQLIWQSPLAHLDHEWGHASSPIVAGDLLIQLADGARSSHLVAYHRYTGAVRWSAARESSGSWTTPVLVKANAGGQSRWELVVNGTGSANGSPGFVIAYNPNTGDELWRVEGTTDIPCSTAIVGEGLIVSTSRANGPVLAIHPGGDGDVSHSHVAWRQPLGGAHVPTGIIEGGRLYIVSDGGILRCMDLEQGRGIWEERLHRSYTASLVAGDGKLFVLSERGDLHVFKLGDERELLAVNSLRERCLATPAIAQGEIFVRTERRLYCFTKGIHDEHDGILGGGGSGDAPAAGPATTGRAYLRDRAVALP